MSKLFVSVVDNAVVMAADDSNETLHAAVQYAYVSQMSNVFNFSKRPHHHLS